MPRGQVSFAVQEHEKLSDEDLVEYLVRTFGCNQWYTATMAKVRLGRLKEVAMKGLIESSKARYCGSFAFKNR